MKAETLKKSILQYAMEGKLVPQDPNDEPASELLKRIKAEKDQLIKDGKIKKEKPLPEITEEEKPFELPQGWEWCRLGSILKISSGSFLPANKMSKQGDIPVYGGNGINGYHDKYLIDKPTLIIGRVGYYCGCVHLSMGKCWVTDNAFITTFSEKNIDINFLKWLLRQANLGTNDNATAQPVVSGKKIYPILIALPPLPEQKRIVKKLEQILPLIDEYGKNEEVLSKINKNLPQKLRQSILQEAVQGKLVLQNPNDEPASELLKRIKTEKEQLIKDKKIKKEKPLPEITEEEKPFELPQGWEWVRLQNLCIKIVDGDHNPPKGELHKTEYIMASSTNINNNKIVELDRVRYLSKDVYIKENLRTNLTKGDILLTTVGTLGRSCIFNDNLNICFQRSVSVISTLIYNKYLKIYFDSPNFQQLINKESTGTAQKGFYLKQLSNVVIPLAPLEEQKHIVEKVEELLTLIDEMKV